MFSYFTKKRLLIVFLAALLIGGIFLFAGDKLTSNTNKYVESVKDVVKKEPVVPPKPVLDTAAYDAKLLSNANLPPPPAPVTKTVKVPATATTPATTKTVTETPVVKPSLWPVKTVYPKAGALLPFNRIIAYYGNFYSKGMGVLGQYPEAEMLAKLDVEVKRWEAADPTTPVVPAIDYIAITAQSSKGKDGKYRLRMPDSQIDHAVELANKIDGIVILEIQIGTSTVQEEIPLLEKYLKMPNVTLALDPEFSMKHGEKPGTVIGTMDATDINYAANYLAKLVRDYDLPPKVLVIHRFTERMVTNYELIKPLAEVQMLMDMDGWGDPAKKLGTYRYTIASEPVQFTGFKLFYKNDLFPPSTRMLSMNELLALSPQPLFIQYQ